MAQNIYDQPDFFAAYSRLDRSIAGLGAAGHKRVMKDGARRCRIAPAKRGNYLFLRSSNRNRQNAGRDEHGD